MVKRNVGIVAVILMLTAACTRSTTRGHGQAATTPPGTASSTGDQAAGDRTRLSGPGVSGDAMLQVVVSGPVSGQLSNPVLSAGSGACGPAEQNSPFELEVTGTINGVKYVFGLDETAYQGLGRYQGSGPTKVAPDAHVGRADQARNLDYFQAGPPAGDEMTFTSADPAAGTFSIDLTAPNTGFAVAGRVSGQFHC